jgi:uncharacterized protein (TIGR02099 family)
MSNIAPFTAVVPAPRRWLAARALVRVGAWLTLAFFGIVLLAWLSLHWVILPHIERWRPLIETQASQILGVPVRIGSIEARSSRWAPTVELHDVTLLDAQLRPALQLSRVLASISARSMLASATSLELRLAQLLIDGARIEVRRDAAGRLFVAGMDFSSASASSDSGAADWFFKQREVAIRGAALRWSDEQRAAPPLELTAVDLVVRNTLRGHRLRLDATPPSAWGERFSLRGEFTQPLLARSGDWRRWSGQVYADARRADASRLRQYLDLPFELSQGVGAVRAWLELREGVARGVTLDLALRTVALRLGADLEPLVVEELQGRLAGQRGEHGGRLSLHQFGFLTGDGVRWPPGDLEFAWTRAADGAIGSGEFSAGRLDLEVIAHTTERLPLGEALRTLLAQVNPRGVASDVRAGWDGSLDAPTHYRFSARVAGLSIDAKAAAGGNGIGRPGLRNASIEIGANEKGGQATLAMQDGALELPGIFEETRLPLDALEAKLRWRIEPRAGLEPAVQVQLIDARLSNPDAQGELHATWRTGAGEGLARGGRFPGVLELDGTLTKGVAARTARYLPLGLPEGARRYVQHAVRGGSLTRATFRVRGDLWDFPFHAGAPGEFRIAVAADDLTLAYAPGALATAEQPDAATAHETPLESRWPPLTKLSGELVIDRTSLAFHDARAQLDGVELAALHGGIGNLTDKPVLTLDTQARGPLADMLRFVDTTPIGDWFQGALRETTANGNGDLKLSLTLPLDDLKQNAVSGSLQIAGSDVRIRRALPVLAAARGRVDFTNRSLAVVGASGRVLGGDVTIDGGTQPDGSLRLNAQGVLTAEGLRRTSEVGALSRLAGALTGQTSYRLTFALVRGLPEIDLASDLVGIASDLPAPLRKSAEAALPLHWQTALVPGATDSPLDTLRFELGNVVRAQYQRELAGDAPRVLRGGIGIGEPAPMPSSGVAAAVSLVSLDIDAWEAASTRLFGAVTAEGAAIAQGGYAPAKVDLRTQELSLAGRKLTGATAGLSYADGQWRARVDADQLAGDVEYRPPGPGSGGSQPGRVYARLARLSLPQNDAEGVTNLLDRQPSSVPALDIVIDDLELRGKRLGRIEVQAVNRLAPERAWELTLLRLSLPEAQLNATGRWAATAEEPRPGTGVRRKAEFQFQLELADSGALLRRLGTVDAIRGGKGRMRGQVAWLGSPMMLDFPSMTGQFNVAIEQGQFLQAQPGAARLLGVLSLQSLARRLTLDFRDVFEEGFAFDSVTGDVAVARGVASTNNLLMRGVQAAVLMEGSADIEHETQDLRVVVVPEINAGAVSLAYAVINPAIGLGTFLAQLFLREPMIQASTREFHVSGSWADPQVEPVVRQPAQGVPRIGPPSGAASSPAR